jgi:hypothetical protein
VEKNKREIFSRGKIVFNRAFALAPLLCQFRRRRKDSFPAKPKGAPKWLRVEC